MSKEKGTVKSYAPIKGTGYIQRENGSDIFFSNNEVIDRTALKSDAKVEYELIHGPQGLCATDINLVYGAIE